MQKIKTAIVEDELKQQEETKGFLDRFGKENGNYEFLSTSYSSPMEFLETYDYSSDVIFLDIKMPGISGMEVAKEIRKKDDKVIIVFITSLAQYAIEGYSVQAEDYILKPLNYSEFKLKMTRIVDKLTFTSGKPIVFTNDKGLFKIYSDNIIYIETVRHSISYHTRDGNEYRRHLSMKECEKELEGYGFVRIDQAFLVNFSYAESILAHSLKLSSGETLKISRPRLAEVNRLFQERGRL
ncbi:MAG: LytTR family DNA-binding domain-containing protein [Bacilli bacterium]|jgi:DNA-binding LytR/AlgR family response regulator|nr:LytTR family DNA-binding domain-containing protein [Bacilli bacterium]